MDAYRATIDWLYSSDDEGLQAYADMAKINLETARLVRDEFDTRDYVVVIYQPQPERLDGDRL